MEKGKAADISEEYKFTLSKMCESESEKKISTIVDYACSHNDDIIKAIKKLEMEIDEEE